MCLFCFANLQKYWKSHAGENIFLVCLCLLYHMSTSLPCACGNGKTMPWCRTAAFPSACINMRYMRPAYAYLCGDNSGILRFLRAWQFTAVKTRVLRRFVNALTHSCLYHIILQKPIFPFRQRGFPGLRKSPFCVPEKPFRSGWKGFSVVRKSLSGNKKGQITDPGMHVYAWLMRFSRLRVSVLRICVVVFFYLRSVYSCISAGMLL